jgi:hypothetical protein
LSSVMTSRIADETVASSLRNDTAVLTRAIASFHRQTLTREATNVPNMQAVRLSPRLSLY